MRLHIAYAISQGQQVHLTFVFADSNVVLGFLPPVWTDNRRAARAFGACYWGVLLQAFLDLGFGPVLEDVVEGGGGVRGLLVQRRLPVGDAELIHQQTDQCARFVGYAVCQHGFIDVSRLVLGDDVVERDAFLFEKHMTP